MSLEKLNHLMYMNDIKIFAKNEKKNKKKLQTIRIYNHVIGIKLWHGMLCLLITKKKKEKREKNNIERNRTTKSRKH